MKFARLRKRSWSMAACCQPGSRKMPSDCSMSMMRKALRGELDAVLGEPAEQEVAEEERQHEDHVDGVPGQPLDERDDSTRELAGG